MDSVRRIGGSTPAGSNGYRAPAEGHDNNPLIAPASRALVPVVVMAPCAPDTGRTRPDAAFLAQLIATKQNLPQARERRRAEPRDVIAAYVAADRAA